MPVLPGYLPLSIIRGIEFQERILRCADDSVTVTGTLVPDATGVYVLSGQFGGYDLYILAGAESYFLYFNATVGSYVITYKQLTTGALVNYWTPTVPITHPTGTYLPQGSNTGTATADDHTIDLTGLTAQAQVRRNSNSGVMLDLNPSVTDPSNGQITIPGISTSDTQDLEDVGTFQWDLVLINGSERIGVFLKGPFVISDNITQPSNT